MDQITTTLAGVALTLLLYSDSATAEAYKWTDAQGNVHYGDKPPAAGQKQQIKIQPPGWDAQIKKQQAETKKRDNQQRDYGTSEDRTLLAEAVQKNDLQGVVRLLAKKTYYRSELLHTAIQNGNMSIFEALLNGDGGFETGYQDKLMMTAIRELRPEFLQILIERGANAGKQDRFESPLMLAIRRQAYECLQLLLEHGAQVNEQNGLPIREAVRNHDMKLLNILIKHGADMNIAEYRGTNPMTPMMIAAYHNYVDMMQVLLDNGADVHKVLQYSSALDHARANKNKEAEAFLLKAGAKR